MIVSCHYCPAEFPDNQNMDKTLPAAHKHRSIFVTTKFRQNLEILKFVFTWFDVFNWKKMIFLLIYKWSVYLAHPSWVFCTPTPDSCWINVPQTSSPLLLFLHPRKGPTWQMPSGPPRQADRGSRLELGFSGIWSRGLFFMEPLNQSQRSWVEFGSAQSRPEYLREAQSWPDLWKPGGIRAVSFNSCQLPIS